MGKIHVIGNTYQETQEHCHESASQQALVNSIKMKESIRVGAPVCDDISNLVNEAYDFLHPDEKALSVKKSSLHRMARDIKNKGMSSKLPAEPEDLDDLGKLAHFSLPFSLFLLSLYLKKLVFEKG